MTVFVNFIVLKSVVFVVNINKGAVPNTIEIVLKSVVFVVNINKGAVPNTIGAVPNTCESRVMEEARTDIEVATSVWVRQSARRVALHERGRPKQIEWTSTAVCAGNRGQSRCLRFGNAFFRCKSHVYTILTRCRPTGTPP